MNREQNRKPRIIITVILGISAIILYMFLQNVGQNMTVAHQFQKEMAQEISRLESMYDDASKRHDYLQRSFDAVYMQDLLFINDVLIEHFYNSEKDPSWHVEQKSKELFDELLKLYKYFNFWDICIVDREGNIKLSILSDERDFKDEIYKPLRAVIDTYQDTSLRTLTEEDICVKYADCTDEEFNGVDPFNLCNYYASPFLVDYALVIAVPAADETALESQSDVWTVLLQNEIIGEQGYIFVWSDKTDTILYHPDQSLKHHNIRELGMDMGSIRDREYGWNTINGQKMYIYPVYDEENEVWIVSAVSQSEMISSRVFVMIIQAITFALLALALIYYVILLIRQDKVHVLADFSGSGKSAGHLKRKYKLFTITVLITTALMLISFYMQTLYLMSSWGESSARQIKRIQETVSLNRDQAKQYQILYDKQKTVQFSAFAQYLYEREDLWTQNTLNHYCEIFEVSNYLILDENGKSILGSTHTDYLPEESEVSEDTAVNYQKMVGEQDQGRDVYDWMKDGRRKIVPVTDYISDVSNYLYAYYYSEVTDLALQSYSLASTLDMARPGIDGFVFTVDRKNYTFTYYPEADMIGENALDYGLEERQFRVNYCDYITVDNLTYYATTDRIDNSIIYFVVLKENLLRSRLLLTLTAVIMAFVMFLVIGTVIYISKEKVETTMPDLERRHDHNDRQSAEYKIMEVLKYYIAFAATILSVYSFLPNNADYSNVFRYVREGRWEYGVNVFALTASIIILCRGGIILFIASRLIGRVSGILPSRNGTILKMVASLFSYIATAFLLYRCMICFGLNPTALMASTGIVAVVLGIGANSLVGDILAGIFLLMEGNVQVGDVVQVGGFRGYVMELGIRMTKLYDMETDDIKIIPNNEVRNVVHMSMRRAIVYSEFQIRYEEKLEDVERIIREELKTVKNKSPYILEGPTYIGVSRLGDSGVCLKTSTRCHEAHRKKVEREVNHIVYTIFQRNHIEVPYTQVTVHTGDDSTVVREFPDEEI